MEKNGQWGTQSKGQLKSGAGVRGAFTQNSYCNKSLLFLFITRWAYKLGAKMGNHFIANDRFILICSGWSYQTVSGRKGSCWKIQQEMQGRGGCEYDLCFSMYGSRKYAYFPTEGFFQFDPPPPRIFLSTSSQWSSRYFSHPLEFPLFFYCTSLPLTTHQKGTVIKLSCSCLWLHFRQRCKVAYFHSRLRQTVVNLDLVTQCSLFYCTFFVGVFTRSGSKLWVMKGFEM